MIKVFTFNTSVLEDDELFDEYMRDMSACRRQKIEAQRSRRNQILSLGAGVAIDMGLREYGLRERDMEYAENRYGKPCFKNCPEIHFNVSHSGNMAVAAFSDGPVGCDVEKIRDANLKIAERFFCREEYQYILAQSDPGLAFWRIWTLKESFLKAIGTGIGIPMNNFRLNLMEDRAKVLQTIDGHDYAFVEYTEDGYRIAVCEQIK